MRIIDGHSHLPLKTGATEALLEMMDSLEIQSAVVVAGGSVSPDLLSQQIALGGKIDVNIENAALLVQCEKTQERLIPFYFANPHHDPEEYREMGGYFSGLKLGPAVHGVPLLHPNVCAFVETAEALNHPVYLHCLPRKGFEVSDLVTLGKQFPRVPFILGHAGIGNCDLYGVSLIKSIPNIFLETSGGFTSVIRRACKTLGSHRVIFGSEYPLQHPRAEIEKLRCLELDTDSLSRIFCTNMLDLLKGGQNA